MKRVIFAAALAAASIPLAVPAIAADDHRIVTPQEIRWSPGPPSLPKGAEYAVLFGDPSKEGLFAMRLKFPKGYRIPPHSHPKPEVVTVISGTFRIGMGEVPDPGKAQELPAGGLFAFPAGMAHYAAAEDDTIVQLNSTGPWGVNYVNPKDDPRQTQ
jgi:quercetin dioxygenase-like cupin family protein